MNYVTLEWSTTAQGNTNIKTQRCFVVSYTENVYIYIIGVQINTCYRRSTSKEVSGYTTSTSSLKMTTHNITFLAVPAPKELQTAKKFNFSTAGTLM